jgi:hypothetical protein
MTATYFARLTSVGAAAVAAASAGSPLTLTNMVVGDGGGADYTPTGTETALHHEVTSAVLDSLSVDSSGNLVVTATFPAAVGNYIAREVGIKDSLGRLIAIGNLPDVTKPDPATGAGVDMVVTLKMAFSGDPSVVVVVNSSAVFVTADGVRSLMHFFGVLSATTVAAPASPPNGVFYLVPPSATGAWAGQDNKIAYFRDPTDGWQFISPPTGARVAAADTKIDYRLLSDGTWEVVLSAAVNLFVWSRQGA